MYKRLNKAQISIFVVISVILVIVGVFLFFNNKFDFFVSTETKLRGEVSDVVNLCLEKNTKKAVFLLGFQGGHIDIKNNVKNFGVNNFLDIGLKIPNWDTTKGNIPTINSMQNELELFVSKNANDCIIDNLKQLEEIIDIDIRDNLSVKAKINPENVIVEASIPISFNEKNVKEDVYTVNDFLVREDNVKLGDLYDLAVQVYNLEASKNFVEDLTIEQIYSASDYSDSKHSMPSEGMGFSCVPRVWTKSQLTRTLVNLNNNNFKYLTFGGTYPNDFIFNSNLNEKYDSEEFKEYYEKLYTFNLAEVKNSFRNYKVDFFIPATETNTKNKFSQRFSFRKFEVTPSSGEIVKAMDFKINLGAKIPIPCMQIYHHLYTLDYDIMVKLTDYSEDGNGYFFQFPLRVLIKNNNPKVKPSTPISSLDKSNKLQDKFCLEENLKYPLLIYVRDKNSGDYLSDVNISYNCMNLQCDIGSTKKPTYMGVTRVYADPRMDGVFPFCFGGSVVAKKEGYHTAKIRVNTDETLFKNQNGNEDIEMIPVKSFEISKSTFLMRERESGLGKRVYTEDDGFVYISIENTNEDFESFGMWPNQEGYLNRVNFLDGEDYVYNISVVYVDSNYNLKGFLELKNYKISNIHNGNVLQVLVPSSSVSIDEKNYVDFFNYMEGGVKINNYGIKLI